MTGPRKSPATAAACVLLGRQPLQPHASNGYICVRLTNGGFPGVLVLLDAVLRGESPEGSEGGEEPPSGLRAGYECSEAVSALVERGLTEGDW